MPLFEYTCHDRRHQFETLVRSDAKVTCPVCHSERLKKQLSVFAVGAAARADRSPAPAPCARCGDPRGPGSCALG